MNAETRRLVILRAHGRCEYCHRQQDDDYFTFHVEHIVAKQHGGTDRLANLCFSCPECNASKGTNLAGMLRGRVIPLYNPRRQLWRVHFRWNGPILIGVTLAGMVTVQVLNINDKDRVQIRETQIAQGSFPPDDDPQE